tara:strand:+ start:2644 stop:3876 length:1233 start_codon:yes stop_codon:yes gene_type:complete
MPNAQKQIQNARIAAAKAKGQRVYVSGVQGQVSLETGVAYHYRGHYVYAYPAGTPIEPIPFQTKRGISIVGTVQDQVPLYAPNDPSLVPEASIGALTKSCRRVWEDQKEEEEQQKSENAEAVEESMKETIEEEDPFAVLEMPTIVRRGQHNARNLHGEAMRSTMTPLIPPQVSSRAGSRVASYTSLSHLAVPSYTPHGRAQYLADSAPGSRLPSTISTPYTSRPVSPARGASSLRQIASTSRLHALLAEDRVPRAFSPLSNVAEGNTHHLTNTSDSALNTDTNDFVEEWLETSALAAYLDNLPRQPSPRQHPIGTGRPRRASLALNQAWNARLGGDQPAQGTSAVVTAREPKCQLHGEGCDGVATTETWKTQHAVETTGFKELYPVVSGAGDRVMVDWFALLREEQAKMK